MSLSTPRSVAYTSRTSVRCATSPSSTGGPSTISSGSPAPATGPTWRPSSASTGSSATRATSASGTRPIACQPASSRRPTETCRCPGWPLLAGTSRPAARRRPPGASADGRRPGAGRGLL